MKVTGTRSIIKTHNKQKKPSHAIGERILSMAEGVLGPGFYQSRRVTQEMMILYPGRESRKKIREFYAGKIEKSIVILGASVVLGLMILMFSETALLDGNRFIRSEPGGTDEEYEVIMEDSYGNTQEVNVGVSSRIYSSDEASEIMTRALEEMDELVLGDNEGFDRIMYDLNMPSSLEPGLISIDWDSSDYNILNDQGQIDETGLSGNGDKVVITGILKYQDLTMEYTRNLTIYPVPMTEEEKITAGIEGAVQEADQNSMEEESMILPDSVNGDSVTWKEKKSHSYIIVIMLGIVASVVIYYNEDNNLKKTIDKRKREMEADYSGILNKMVLLLGAGMTMRSVWERIAVDYARHGIKKRYAYEEMLLTLNEMKSGTSEMTAYEHFGSRCSGTSYMKLSSTLTQNLKKGSRGLLEIFRNEAHEANELRKNQVRKQGEEAGTKLLIPMIMMLGVVLIIVIVPAFQSMNI